MPLTVWLRDRIGHKTLYILSLAVFTGGSLLCALSWNLPTMVFARVIQAAGGGALTPTGMAMITEVFDPRERGKALGFWAMGAVTGPAFGPTVGGYLTKYFGWPSIFLVNLPIGILGILLAVAVLKLDKPAEKDSHKPFDAWGFSFLAAFLVSLLLALSKGETDGWTSQFILGCVAVSFVSFVLFLVAEQSAENPIVELELLKVPVFTATLVLTAARSLVLYGGTFLLPVFLENFRGLDEVESGLLLLPGPLLMAVLMPITGRMADKFGPRYLCTFGFVGLGLFFFLYRTIDMDTSTWGIIYPTLIRGLGISLLIAPLTATAMNALPTRKAGMASSMMNLIQQVGGSMGIAALGLVLHRRTTFHLAIAGANLNDQSSAYHRALAGLIQFARNLGLSHADSGLAAHTLLATQVAKVAQVHAFQDTFLVGAVLVVISMIGLFYLPTRPIHGRPGAEPIAME
jgi:DHA2 family multidrug resistance protein